MSSYLALWTFILNDYRNYSTPDSTSTWINCSLLVAYRCYWISNYSRRAAHAVIWSNRWHFQVEDWFLIWYVRWCVSWCRKDIKEADITLNCRNSWDIRLCGRHILIWEAMDWCYPRGEGGSIAWINNCYDSIKYGYLYADICDWHRYFMLCCHCQKPSEPWCWLCWQSTRGCALQWDYVKTFWFGQRIENCWRWRCR